MNIKEAKLCLKIFRYENSADEPAADKEYLLETLAKELGYKVYDGFKDDVLTCIKDNTSEDEMINCIRRKLKRHFEPEKSKEQLSSAPKNDSATPRSSLNFKK